MIQKIINIVKIVPLVCFFTINSYGQTWEIGNPNVSDVVATLVNGTMTISGTGNMQEYGYNPLPWDSHKSNITSVIIGNGVNNICDFAFSDCSNLTSVIIGNSVTTIGDTSFGACTGLKTITIPNSVTALIESTFNGSGLTTITIPYSVTSIGYGAFFACHSLTAIHVDNNNTVYSSDDGVLLNKEKNTIIQYPGGKTGAYTIPASVTTIGLTSFMDSQGLTSVSIGNSVTSIGNGAFSYCPVLKSVSIGYSVNSIGGGAFFYCDVLTTINVDESNAVYTSESGVLFNKDKTTLIKYPDGKTGAYTIPSSVTSIVNGAFEHCSFLSSVIIPNSLTSIGSFSNCTSLTSIIIPNSVTSIGSFSNCTSLTSIIIPNSVSSIGMFAFSGCTSLKTITIPHSVTSIGNNAFYYCYSLTDVSVNWETPLPVTAIFHLCPVENIKLHVPEGTYDLYAAAPVWQDFNITTDFIIMASAGSNGIIEPSGSVPVSEGESKTFNFFPNSGCEIAQVIVNGSNVGTANSYTFPNVTSRQTIQVTFKSKTQRLTFDAQGGTVNPNFKDVTNATQVGALPIPTHPNGYIFDGWWTGTNGSGMQYTSSTVYYASDNTTLYAKWITYIPGTYLVETTWNQRPYYNNYCPSGVPAGCVATVMAQIMKYYGHPLKGTGSNSYSCGNYGTLSANFGETSYQWKNMPNKLTALSKPEEIDAVATLMYHSGIAVNMLYTSGGSGSNIVAARDALKTYFGYDSNIRREIKDNYKNANDWYDLLRSEINVRRPMYYRGSDPVEGGHAFICDGYDNDDFFHFNWGWGGSGDDWFQIWLLDPNEYNFSVSHEILVNIKPTSLPPMNDQLTSASSLSCGTSISGTLSGATNGSDNQNDVFYSFTAESTGGYTITLNNFEGDKDLFLYNGSTLLGSSIGVNRPAEKISYSCTAGTTYDIRVVDASNTGGAFIISLSCPNQYSIIFDMQNGAEKSASQTVTYGDNVGLLPTPTLSGYSFGGWWTEPNGSGTQYSSSTTFSIEDNTTLYAKWVACSTEETWNIGHPVAVNVIATLENGTLTISGTGEMTDFNSLTMPWYNVRDEITSVVINSGVSNIGNYALHDCPNLISISISNNVTSIGDDAFSACSCLASVIFSNSITSIGKRAFEGCNLISLSIPNSVKSIGERAFANNAALSSVTIPISVSSVGQSAFAGCTSLALVNYNAINCTEMGNESNPVFSGCTNLSVLNIGGNVTNIPAYGFAGCSSLASVTIPKNVTSIGKFAFQNCSNLTLVNFNATNCSDMMQSDTYHAVFSGCTNFTKLQIGSNVTNIPAGVFYECSRLSSVSIPSSVISIGKNAFYRCSGLTSLYIGNSVETIGNWAFAECGSLPFVSIPNSVTSTGISTFRDCSRLTSVIIPSTVAHIGDYLFYNCSNLTEISSNNPVPPTVGLYSFSGVNQTICTLYVPAGSQCIYAAAPGWQEFDIVSAQHTITATTGNGGNISPEGIEFVKCGGSKTYIFTPNSGYEINEVLIDGSAHPAAKTNGQYTFSNVTDNHTISVTFSTITGIEDVLEQQLKIYPNPFNGTVRISCADVETWRAASLRVTNAAGVVVHTQNITSPDETIRLEHLPAGVYFFSVEKDGQTKTMKVIKN